MRMRSGKGHRLRKPCEKYSFQTANLGRQPRDFFSRPFQDNRFDAVMMIYMDMRGAEDQVVRGMLNLEHSLIDVALVVVVDESEHPDDSSAFRPGLFDDLLAYQIPYELRAAAVSFMDDLLIKRVQQLIRERYREPYHDDAPLYAENVSTA